MSIIEYCQWKDSENSTFSDFATHHMAFNNDIPQEAQIFFYTLFIYKDNPEKMSSFTKSLLDRITYNSQIASTEVAFDNLKRMHPSLNETNPFALAYMASNPSIPEEEREILKKCFKQVVDAEQRNLQRFLQEREVQTNDMIVDGNVKLSEEHIENDNLRGHENCDANEPISNYKEEWWLSK